MPENATPPPTGQGTGVPDVDFPTPELVEQLTKYLRLGNYIATAARAVGITPLVFQTWHRLGSGVDAIEPYVSFRADVDKAIAEGEALNVGRVAQAARENWQAAAWLLERQHPERWARPSQREKTGSEKPLEPSDEFAEVDELAARRRLDA